MVGLRCVYSFVNLVKRPMWEFLLKTASSIWDLPATNLPSPEALVSPLQVYECVKRILPVMAKDMGHILLKISENSQLIQECAWKYSFRDKSNDSYFRKPYKQFFFLPTNFEKYKILIFRADIYNSHEWKLSYASKGSDISTCGHSMVYPITLRAR